MALITENGWPQVGRSACVNPVVPGTADVRPEVRAGDAATILIAWCAWWHKNIRPIDRYKPRDYWGWSATNAVWNSNHLSGTAVDLNATELPWQRRTMSAAEVARIEEGLRLFDGTIFWGGHWDRVDQMHAQLNLPEGHPKIREFAEKLNNGHLGIYGPAPQDADNEPAWDDVLHQLMGDRP
ncbi:M15 family metallopeptidase [Nocardia cyriacigeorgica]|uniref:M15 family metallopeptidase n=1 Tax=Nocardia cyriacigeorgica TaxID=135487 RepID=UPI0018954EB4|nr:M15 family metallopeptidase [Nocardia cyriacigeorgica]MBF6085230.1 M15 family metallopeptidase [Nocardia cyriacigeorgica]